MPEASDRNDPMLLGGQDPARHGHRHARSAKRDARCSRIGAAG
jgi:hypothetical protein